VSVEVTPKGTRGGEFPRLPGRLMQFVNDAARHPDQVWVELGKEKVRVRPELLKGEERGAMWQRVIQASPNYASYATKTDCEIPLVRLVPA
jgi:hypothetical protein